MTLRIRSRAVAVSLVAMGVAAMFAAVPHTPAVVVALPPTSTDGVHIAAPLDAANGGATGKRHY